MEEIKTVPDIPWSHPFVERLIGTIRREFLDHIMFWISVDLERKLLEFRDEVKASGATKGSAAMLLPGGFWDSQRPSSTSSTAPLSRSRASTRWSLTSKLVRLTSDQAAYGAT